MATKERVRIVLEEDRGLTKITVETLQRSALQEKDEKWIRNLEVTAKEVELNGPHGSLF